MRNIEIAGNPEFSEELRALETTDKAHADIFNEVHQVLIQNDVHLKKLSDGMLPFVYGIDTTKETNFNIDDKKKNAFYYLPKGLPGNPRDMTGVLEIIGYKEARVIQRINYSDDRIYHRYWDGTNWTNWKQVSRNFEKSVANLTLATGFTNGEYCRVERSEKHTELQIWLTGTIAANTTTIIGKLPNASDHPPIPIRTLCASGGNGAQTGCLTVEKNGDIKVHFTAAAVGVLAHVSWLVD